MTALRKFDFLPWAKIITIIVIVRASNHLITKYSCVAQYNRLWMKWERTREMRRTSEQMKAQELFSLEWYMIICVYFWLCCVYFSVPPCKKCVKCHFYSVKIYQAMVSVTIENHHQAMSNSSLLLRLLLLLLLLWFFFHLLLLFFLCLASNQTRTTLITTATATKRVSCEPITNNT